MKGGARLGQHFLKARWIATMLAYESGAKKGDTVVEIGPGKGVLTVELLRLGAKVIAIEIDGALIPILKEKFAGEIASGTLTLIHADIMDDSITMKKFGFEGNDYRVAANIPYYITGAIIRRFLSICRKPKSMTLLMQKEVAERIAKSKKESILSLSVKAYGTPRYIKTVSRSCFSPSPKVDSAILTIENISQNFFSAIDEKYFFEIIRLGFSSKRKFLINNLSIKYEKIKLSAAFSACDIPEKSRAEDIELEKWKCLTKQLPKASQ
ncbi:ribosomal RNA small subunit methyltransferase A [Candidatus Kaiserbacteria bacterium CG10_big_fil_rev_8_21_14_0_10_43_70]|uniref:Ribosomal RNA small subunit methyltransferase A n=1 Tax=Candidatus Kaiserbacteria bacterium CG10_big_fil_rev_8_21_14_0_10_43_70 TaxID=1974605 RepID=A0A2H0UJ58_9BACT|nr:MAG: ribosomal RNA small subunit methyltransferase A [Candidatus Kaiserbacteria bacterium CG10_big_fil_rev_8_21_14_0_10_43_70]